MFQGIASPFFIKLYFFPCNLRAMQISIYILCVKFTCKHNYYGWKFMWRQPRPRWSKAEPRFAWRTRISFVCQLACKHNYIGYKSCGDNHYRDGTKRNRGSHGAHVYYSTCRGACSHTSSCVRTIIFYFVKPP